MSIFDFSLGFVLANLCFLALALFPCLCITGLAWLIVFRFLIWHLQLFALVLIAPQHRVGIHINQQPTRLNGYNPLPGPEQDLHCSMGNTHEYIIYQ